MEAVVKKRKVEEKGELQMQPLGEIFQPSRPRVSPADKPNLPFIGMEHVEAHTMKLLGTVPAGTMRSSSVHFQPGDVLYGRLRPYLNKVYRPDFEGLCSAEFIVFPNAPDVDTKYLQYFLNSYDFVSFATHLNEGDRPRVDFKQIAPYPFPLAPLPEQRRIVQAIETQLGRLDAAVAHLHAAKAKLKRYKQSVLKAAVEEAGEDPNAETVVLADVADLCLGKMLDRQKNKGTPHPYLRNINVRWGAFETEDLHQMPFGDHEHERYGLEVGDLVMCEGGEPGRCAVWDGSIPDMKIQKALHRIRCNTSTDPHFVMFNVLSAAWLGTIDKYYTGTTIKHLTGKMLARFELVLPPIKVQRRLVMRIQEAFERTEEMESTLDAQLAHSTRLRQSVLKRAFEGRLV